MVGLHPILESRRGTLFVSHCIQLLTRTQAATTWEEGQKMDAIRKAYQRAVQIPMDNVKRVWEEYQEFENNLNKITVSTQSAMFLYILLILLTGEETHCRLDPCAHASANGFDYLARTYDSPVPSASAVQVQDQYMAPSTTELLRWR